MRLNHVSLTVRDRERSAEFYAKHFGMARRVHDDEHLLILEDDAGSLLALRAGGPPTPLPAANHFGFLLASSEEVLAARRAFRDAGVNEIEWQSEAPTRVQVLDPDGYQVEVYAY